MDDFDLEAAAPPGGRSETERAIDLAYKAAARRERTVAELRTCLERKRVGPHAIDDAVAELTRSGFLDDARYARQFAEDKRQLEQWGSDRIARDLRRRGIGPELVDAALCDSSHETELDTALMVLQRRFPVAPAGDRERDRAWRLLVRRGFTPEVAYEAVRALERRSEAA
jgi:regulatory protein